MTVTKLIVRKVNHGSNIESIDYFDSTLFLFCKKKKYIFSNYIYIFKMEINIHKVLLTFSSSN